jgi:hypothetical protein
MFKTSIRSFSIAAILTIGSSSLVYAQSAEDIAIQEALVTLDASLPGKLINNPYDIKWRTDGSDKKEKIVKSKGAPGDMAYSVTVKKKKQNHWDTATRIPITTDIPKGDTILVSFWARAAKPQKGKEVGKIVAVLQRTSEPYDSIFEEDIDLGTEWKLHSVAGTASRDYSAEKVSMNFNLAKAKQTIELGQFYVMNLGPNADASKYLK